MARVIHFEVPVDDPARAQRFYEQALGWSFQSWGDQPYWLATAGPEGEQGINGALTLRDQDYPHVTNTVGVASLDETVQRIEAAGGRILRERQPVPGIGWFALCMDTEGNRFGVLQEDPAAA